MGERPSLRVKYGPGQYASDLGCKKATSEQWLDRMKARGFAMHQRSDVCIEDSEHMEAG
jgi:hypothetical protein